jgi:hypothetical protein
MIVGMMLSGECGDVCCGGLGLFACGDDGESDDGVSFVDVTINNFKIL